MLDSMTMIPPRRIGDGRLAVGDEPVEMGPQDLVQQIPFVVEVLVDQSFGNTGGPGDLRCGDGIEVLDLKQFTNRPDDLDPSGGLAAPPVWCHVAPPSDPSHHE